MARDFKSNREKNRAPQALTPEDLAKQVGALQARAVEVQKQIDKSEAQLADLNAKVKSQHEVLQGLHADHRRRNDEASAKLRDDIAALNKELEGLRNEASGFWTELKNREISADAKLGKAEEILQDVKTRELKVKDDLNVLAKRTEKTNTQEAEITRKLNEITRTAEHNEAILANILEREKAIDIKLKTFKEAAARKGILIRSYPTKEGATAQ